MKRWSVRSTVALGLGFIAAISAGGAGFTDSKILAIQVSLDRAGYSSNAADGQWGRKTQSALEWWASANGSAVPATVEAAYRQVVKPDTRLFRYDLVTQAEIDSLVKLPLSIPEKAKLPQLGYETIAEMYAERGHLSVVALKRLNPGVDFRHVNAGTRILIPDFPSAAEELNAGKLIHRGKREQAERLTVSLSRFEVVAFNDEDRPIAVFPCSIAADKAKLPKGVLKITTLVPEPNYTYTPDAVPKGEKTKKYILAAGPNNPVGLAWIGLSLPGYGIHGTPFPERIGRAESHGCFRLANWNAVRLFAMVNPGTKVEVVQ